MGEEKRVIIEDEDGAQYSVPESATKGKGAYAGKGYKVIGDEGTPDITGGPAVETEDTDKE